MLDQQITQITNRSGEDCDEKIRELLEKFQGFVTRIGEWEGDASRFEGLLAALKTEIDRLCDKADEIIAKNGENRSGLDEELRKVEEAMGQERGASKKMLHKKLHKSRKKNLKIFRLAGKRKMKFRKDYYFCEPLEITIRKSLLNLV